MKIFTKIKIYGATIFAGGYIMGTAYGTEVWWKTITGAFLIASAILYYHNSLRDMDK